MTITPELHRQIELFLYTEALALEDKGYTVADAVAKAEVIWNDTLFTTAIQDHLNSPEAIGLADMVSDAIRELEVRDGAE